MAECRFCKSPEHIEYFHFKNKNINWQILKCKKCSTFYLFPFPTEKQLIEAYNTDYYGNSENKFTPIIEKSIGIFRQLRAKRFIKNIPQNSNLLDIGCGNGKFLNHLDQIGNFNLYGTELEGKSAERASKITNISLKIGELSESTFQNNYFNAISLYHVFEHLQNPVNDLRIIKKKLKLNGYLTIAIPNIDSWQAKIFKKDWFHLDFPRHLIFFAPNDLIQLMQKNGFEIVKTHYWSLEQNPFGWTQSFLNSISKENNFLYEILKGNKKVIQKKNWFKIIIHFFLAILSTPFFILLSPIESIFKKAATVEFKFKLVEK